MLRCFNWESTGWLYRVEYKMVLPKSVLIGKKTLILIFLFLSWQRSSCQTFASNLSWKIQYLTAWRSIRYDKWFLIHFHPPTNNFSLCECQMEQKVISIIPWNHKMHSSCIEQQIKIHCIFKKPGYFKLKSIPYIGLFWYTSQAPWEVLSNCAKVFKQDK